MSMWTHVIGAIHIDTYRQLGNIELFDELTDMLRSAPKITGSEGNCQISVVVDEGSDLWVSHDCHRCPQHFTDKEDDEDFEDYPCDAPEDFQCPSGEYSTRASIILCGDLRDCNIDKTAEEVNAFVDWVEEHFYIRNMSIKIEDETEEIVRW